MESKPNPSDRRTAPRFEVKLNADIVCSHSKGHQEIKGRLINVSSGGFLISAESNLSQGTLVSVNFLMPITESPVQFVGRIVWNKILEGHVMREFGVHVTESLSPSGDLTKFINALTQISTHHDRRKDIRQAGFPLRNRQDDYAVLSDRSPYFSFFSSLKEYSKGNKIDNLILSSSLVYLKKRIRAVISDEPKIILSDHLDEELAGETVVVMNLDCRRRHESFTPLDFEEYLLKNNGFSEPLKTLNLVSQKIKTGTKISIFSLGKIANQKLATKYLQVAKFQKPSFYGHHTVFVEKRDLFHALIKGGRYVIREIQSKHDIDKIQEFSARYYATGFNFSKEIDNLFSNQSHFYGIYCSKTDEIITCARITWHLPNHPLPCMLANKMGTEAHVQLQDPDNISYGEIYAPYMNSYSACKTYGELIKRFYHYVDEDFIDVFLTTHKANNSKEFEFLSHYLGCKDTKVLLKYGSFGGEWNLIFFAKDHFLSNLQINFATSDHSPKLLNSFLT